MPGEEIRKEGMGIEACEGACGGAKMERAGKRTTNGKEELEGSLPPPPQVSWPILWAPSPQLPSHPQPSSLLKASSLDGRSSSVLYLGSSRKCCWGQISSGSTWSTWPEALQTPPLGSCFYLVDPFQPLFLLGLQQSKSFSS